MINSGMFGNAVIVKEEENSVHLQIKQLNPTTREVEDVLIRPVEV